MKKLFDGTEHCVSNVDDKPFERSKFVDSFVESSATLSYFRLKS